MKAITEDIKTVIRSIRPALESSNFSILWSEKGCGKQSEHSDFDGILSFENSTKLIIRDGENKEVTIKIGVKEMLFFRGDVLHRVASYPGKENKR